MNTEQNQRAAQRTYSMSCCYFHPVPAKGELMHNNTDIYCMHKQLRFLLLPYSSLGDDALVDPLGNIRSLTPPKTGWEGTEKREKTETSRNAPRARVREENTWGMLKKMSAADIYHALWKNTSQDFCAQSRVTLINYVEVYFWVHNSEGDAGKEI